MNCYECAKEGDEKQAVATCMDCNAGLCLNHLNIAAATIGPGGTRYNCTHDTWSESRALNALEQTRSQTQDDSLA